ncbi:ATP-binding protein [Microbacterium yannicii]|uniref:ATP-binding protein n=1 Tax=Microbacterium yannicii TaxID=671622 RepID=UPI0002E40C93|nr:hypothetical protein [Microbacterium yannicii]
MLEAGLLLPTVAYVLGIRDTGAGVLEERIGQAIGDRRVLIVLDNFEQIVEEAPVLVRLYSLAPNACFLVTSRVVLRIRGERVFEVEPLQTPDADTRPSLAQARASSACVLFAERAAASQPSFVLDADNAADVIAICRRVDGLPLAIELAAARIRLLSPRDVLERLEKSLPLLSTAARDLPDRHRTLRATIDWSVGLLQPTERGMLEDLGVFGARFTLEAVEAVGAARSWHDGAIETLATLIDASLVQRTDTAGRSVFSLLATVREYAVDELESHGEADALRIAHADYYLALVHRVAPRLRGSGQVEAVTELGLEVANLRAAARHLVRNGRLDDAGAFAWTMLPYWWISGYFADVSLWMEELLSAGIPITDHTRAVATFFPLWADVWRRPADQVVAALGECVDLFVASGDMDAAAMALAAKASTRMQFPDLEVQTARSELEDAVARLGALGNRWAQALAEVALGQLGVLCRDIPSALVHFDRAVEISDAADDAFTRVVSGNNRARLRFMLGEHEAAEAEFLFTLTLSIRLHFVDGATYGIEGACAIAAIRGESWRAGALAAVAASVRESTGVYDIAGFAVHLEPLEALRAKDPESVAAGERAGADMGLAEGIRLALPAAGADAAVREAVPAW